MSPPSGAPDLTLRYEQEEPGAWGTPSPGPSPPTAPWPPALPPAGRAAAGRSFGRVWKVASPGESSDSSASFFAFSLLRRLWESGTGRVGRLLRVGARLRRGGRTEPWGSRAGQRGRRGAPGPPVREGGRPAGAAGCALGLRARRLGPWWFLAPYSEGVWLSRPVAVMGRRGQSWSLAFLGAVPAACCARLGAGQPCCVKGPERSFCPIVPESA